jgi:hypothetical protein
MASEPTNGSRVAPFTEKGFYLSELRESCIDAAGLRDRIARVTPACRFDEILMHVEAMSIRKNKLFSWAVSDHAHSVKQR